ncbi:MAG: fasciclin domain-containing protein [Bacteroidetes bacterium]|nr:fasciclin domain-containing protein [Bacteroidota bacterium]
MKKKIFTFSSVLGTLLLASNGIFAQTNVFDNVIATSPNHTYLEAALIQENLAGALQNPSATLTVFAPDDAAFTALATALGTDINGLLALPNLDDILLYHVLGTTVPSTAVTNGAIVSPLSPTNTLKLTLTGTGNVFANHAQVTTANLNASNGTVHVTNAVLLPVETVADVAIDNGFSTLVTAVVRAELLPALTNPLANYTVFAPTNQAFDNLATALNTTVSGLLALPNLADVLTYHVLGTEVPSSAVTNGAIVQPLSSTNTLKLTATSTGNVFVNQAQVTSVDINADNGIVHVLNAVVLPVETVADVAIDNGFSTLVTAVVTAELLPALTNPLANYTVFAPTNDAFDDLADELGTTVNGLLALPGLADILTYHVLGTEVLSSAVTNGAVVQPLSTTNTLKLTATADGDVFVNQAQVTAVDINADNGVVHVLDAVVLPIETVVDVALDNGFSTLATAVVTAELLPVLTDPFSEFTVFAPTNAAFDNLATALNTDLAGILALPNLADVLTYHVVDGTVLSTQLTAGPVATVNGEDVIVSLTNGVQINDATVTLADVLADNGVVHVVDGVLLPPTADLTENTSNEVSYYPNPCADVLHFATEIPSIITLSDLNGRTIFSKEVTSTLDLNMSNLSQGSYLLNISNATGAQTKTVVKY